MHYNFYFDETFHDRKISISEKGKINVLDDNANESYIGLFWGCENTRIKGVIKQLRQLENKYKEIYSLGEEQEFKSTTIGKQNFTYYKRNRYFKEINMLKFICYPKCTTCQKAKKWLDDNKIEYKIRDIKENNPNLDELTAWYKTSGLPLKKFFNTSGLLYKSMELKDKLPNMSEDEQLKLLATDGMLVKRPLVIGEDFVLLGFKESKWKEKVWPKSKTQ